MRVLASLLIVTIAGFAVVALRPLERSRRRLPIGFRATRIGWELSTMLIGGIGDLVQERLRSSPRLARVRAVHHRFVGDVLLMEVDELTLRLRLYRPAPDPWLYDPVMHRSLLLSVDHLDEIGWAVHFAGPGGPQRYLGWLLESWTRPRPPRRPPAANAI